MANPDLLTAVRGADGSIFVPSPNGAHFVIFTICGDLHHGHGAAVYSVFIDGKELTNRVFTSDFKWMNQKIELGEYLTDSPDWQEHSKEKVSIERLDLTAWSQFSQLFLKNDWSSCRNWLSTECAKDLQLEKLKTIKSLNAYLSKK